MTNQMPERIYVFGQPDSIGGRGFTVTEPKDDYIEYIRADLAQKTVTQPSLRVIVLKAIEKHDGVVTVSDVELSDAIANALITSGIVKVSS